MEDVGLNDVTQMVVVDLDLRILAVSDSLLWCLCYIRDDLVGQSADIVVDFGPEWLRTEVQALRCHRPWKGDLAMRRKDGRLVLMSAEVRLIRHTDGDQIVGVLNSRACCIGRCACHSDSIRPECGGAA